MHTAASGKKHFPKLLSASEPKQPFSPSLPQTPERRVLPSPLPSPHPRKDLMKVTSIRCGFEGPVQEGCDFPVLIKCM